MIRILQIYKSIRIPRIPNFIRSTRVGFVDSWHTGFTLVEALVSLTLLTTALVPAFILATDAVRLSTRIRNSLIASNLAQEGVEVVRAMRDANWLTGQPFGTGLDGVCATGCRVEWNSLSLIPGTDTPPLLWDKESGLYQYLTGVNSPFSRKITITPGPSNVGLVVKSDVSWIERTIPKTITIEYHLFDWTK